MYIQNDSLFQPPAKTIKEFPLAERLARAPASAEKVEEVSAPIRAMKEARRKELACTDE